MHIRGLAIYSCFTRYTLCTVRTFPLRPLVSGRIVAVSCHKVLIHTDISLGLVGLTKASTSRIISVGYVSVLCPTICTLSTRYALVALGALQTLNTTFTLRAPISSSSFITFCTSITLIAFNECPLIPSWVCTISYGIVGVCAKVALATCLCRTKISSAICTIGISEM